MAASYTLAPHAVDTLSNAADSALIAVESACDGVRLGRVHGTAAPEGDKVDPGLMLTAPAAESTQAKSE